MKRISGRSTKAHGIVAGLTLAVAACGGGGSDDAVTTTTPAPAGTQRVTGVLVSPEAVSTTSAVAMKYERAAETKSDDPATAQAPGTSCVGIPAGYNAVANATVSFTDSAGAAVGTPVTTDSCGRFDALAVPSSATGVAFAGAAGFQPISVPISTLVDRNADGIADPVSTFPAGARLEIVGASLFADRLSFIVRDSATGKAVLGIPPAAITVSGPAGALVLGQFAYTATSGPASISLVLDASGSMSSSAATGSALTRYQVAAAAAKLFVDRIGSSDLVGTVAFDNTADFLNPDYFTATWRGTVVDAAGQPVPLGLPASGFTGDKTTLNRLVDFYNPRSDGWRLATAPVRFTTRSYPWGGSTALWDAVSLGADRVVTQNGRQFVVAMTDGADNASRTTVAALTLKVVAAKLPVFTVGIGSTTSINTTNLQSLATASGGSFTLVSDADVQARLAGAFDSIRTGIQFQYGGTLASALAAGTALRIGVSYAGLSTEASLVAN